LTATVTRRRSAGLNLIHLLHELLNVDAVTQAVAADDRVDLLQQPVVTGSRYSRRRIWAARAAHGPPCRRSSIQASTCAREHGACGRGDAGAVFLHRHEPALEVRAAEAERLGEVVRAHELVLEAVDLADLVVEHLEGGELVLGEPRGVGKD
jgi:hypothetical protein